MLALQGIGSTCCDTLWTPLCCVLNLYGLVIQQLRVLLNELYQPAERSTYVCIIHKPPLSHISHLKDNLSLYSA